jgi:hypothetical protein
LVVVAAAVDMTAFGGGIGDRNTTDAGTTGGCGGFVAGVRMGTPKLQGKRSPWSASEH